jgi:hypothetical protein
MSNERPDSADRRALSAQERRKERAAAEALDTAFAAKLADVTPRSRIDAAALQFEAGYRAGLAERRGALRLTQGLAALTTAAMLLAAASAWMNYEAFVGQRQALVAALDARASDDPKSTTVATENVSTDAASEDDAAEEPSRPSKRNLRPRGDDVIAAGAAMERRYLTPRLRFGGEELQWKDLYDLSTEPVSTTLSEPSGGGGPRSAPASPWSAGGPVSPWSAWPSSRQVDDLLEQGI